MALTDENGGGIPATMLVAPTGNIGGGMPYPVYMGGQGGSGNGGNGWDNGWWIILLFILLASGNWGNNNGGNNGGGMFGGGMPIVVNDGNGSSVQRGFDQAAIMSGLSGIQNGVQGLSTQLCNCCGDMQMALANGFANVETGANARQMANMQTAFAGQTAMAQGFNQLASQFADCCCENRLATADLRYTIATENCADRYEAAQNTRDILENCNRNNQAILDKLCQLELNGKNDRIADLERQLTMANLAASQTAQTSRILADNAAQTVALEQYLNPVPIPAYVVQNPNCCQNTGCGCGSF